MGEICGHVFVLNEFARLAKWHTAAATGLKASPEFVSLISCWRWTAAGEEDVDDAVVVVEELVAEAAAAPMGVDSSCCWAAACM